jgi:hypothetical protein
MRIGRKKLIGMDPLLRFVPSRIASRRVLVEHTDAAAGIAIARALHDAGYAVATCPGPRIGEPCPELEDRRCPLASRAGAIVWSLREHPDGRRIAACLRGRYPDIPLLVGLDPPAAVGAVTAALSK